MAKHSVRGKDVIKVAKELATPRRGGKEDFTHNRKDPCPRYRTVQHPITDLQICRLAPLRVNHGGMSATAFDPTQAMRKWRN